MIEYKACIQNEGDRRVFVDRSDSEYLIYRVNKSGMKVYSTLDLENFTLNGDRLINYEPFILSGYSNLLIDPSNRDHLASYENGGFVNIFDLYSSYVFGFYRHYSLRFFPLSKINETSVEYGFFDAATRDTFVSDYPVYALGANIFGAKHEQIQRLSETGDILWSRNYESEFASLDRSLPLLSIVDIVEDILFCQFDHGNYGVGIDIDTGDVKWINEGNFKSARVTPDGMIATFGPPVRLRDPETGKEVGMFGEYDPRMMAGRFHYIFIGDHVILTGNPTDTIAAFNLKTYQIDWIHKEEGVWFPATAMKYFDPYLFVNDSKGNLHVFEVGEEVRNPSSKT